MDTELSPFDILVASLEKIVGGKENVVEIIKHVQLSLIDGLGREQFV